MRRGKARLLPALPEKNHFYLDMERISILIFMFPNVFRVSATVVDCIIQATASSPLMADK